MRLNDADLLTTEMIKIPGGIPRFNEDTAFCVVRCRECENWKPYGSKAARKLGDPLERYGGCEIWRGGHLESDFCSYGERRAGNGNQQ